MANIPGTNVPAITFDLNVGFVAPSGPDVLTGVQTDITAAFGQTLNYDLRTPQGQIASSEAALINYFDGLFVYYTNQTNPSYASGRMQDAIGEIYFLTRLPSLPTKLQIACSGLFGVVIPENATIIDTSGNTYVNIAAGTIPSGGSITLEFDCITNGPVPVPSADQVSIYQTIPGWDTVSVVSGTEGRDVEGRSAFEERRKESVAGNSFGAASSILGAVAKLPDVTDYFAYDNAANTQTTVQGVLIAANSIYVCVSGGTDQDVAKAIISKKAPGCSYTGNTTVQVFDTNPLYAQPPSYTVKFTRPTLFPIFFAVNIINGPTTPSDAVTQVQNAIIAASEGADGGPRARIASTILASRYVTPVVALGAWALVRTLFVGSSNAADAVIQGRIVGATLTVDSVTSGAVAIGQMLADVLGLVAAGTKITAGAGVTWTVSQPQTLGATFTGTGSGTNLTASAVTGTIAVGETITGTGAPANTKILSQTSGTPGGAGVYVTSNATTSAGASLKSSATLSCVAINDAEVDVNADQEPEVIAANILVTLS